MSRGESSAPSHSSCSCHSKAVYLPTIVANVAADLSAVCYMQINKGRSFLFSLMFAT